MGQNDDSQIFFCRFVFKVKNTSLHVNLLLVHQVVKIRNAALLLFIGQSSEIKPLR
jgi:hypothetical protein